MMNEHNNLLLPNNNNDGEVRSNDGIIHHSFESNNKRQRVIQQTAVVDLMRETEMERMEDQLYMVRRSFPAKMMNHGDCDAFDRWHANAVGMMEELHHFLLRRDQQPQQQPQLSSDANTILAVASKVGAHSTCQDAATNDHNYTINNNHVGEGGEEQSFQRSQELPTSMYQWKEQLDFLEFCYSLKCNHSNIRKVDIPSYYDAHFRLDAFPDGRLRFVGNAMLQNTHITELTVDVGILDSQENYDILRATALIEFVRTSTVLRKVGIWSDSGYTLRNHFAELILDAIAANASIHELDISGAYPVGAFHKLMSTTTSLRVLHIDCDDFTDICSKDYRTRLLQALASNRTIDYLSFSVRNNGWVSLQEIPSYMSSGPAMVRKLTLKGCRQLPTLFFDLMKTTSLQTLEVEGDLEEYNSEHKGMLQDALANNNSIENLKMIYHSHFEMNDDILLHLHTGPSTLQKLSLKSYSESFDGLRQFLCRTTATLQHLELEDCFLLKDSMNCLLEGLYIRDSRQSTALMQVTLKSCRFSIYAVKGLAEFIAQLSKHHTCHYRVAPGWLLLSKEMSLVTAMQSPPEMKKYPYAAGDTVLASMSTTLLSLPSSGISSDHPGPMHCISLSMHQHGDVPAYCDALMTIVEVSSLVCLQLSHVGPPDSLKLAHCLPRLRSLSALHLINIQDDVLPTTILNGLKRNGRLLTTSFWTAGQRRFFRNRHDRIVVQSYCERNRFLLEMIVRNMAFFRISHVDTVVDANCNHLEESHDLHNNRVVLLPSLFRVASAIPLIRSRFRLVALLELGATIGPQGGQVSL